MTHPGSSCSVPERTTELPTKAQIESKPESIDKSELLRKLRIELKKTKKKLQQYELNKVGKQQEQFIE